jgi:hypothetical protein
MTDLDRCLPWFYPAVNITVRVCDAMEVMEFNKIIEEMPTDKCKVRMQRTVSYYLGNSAETIS